MAEPFEDMLTGGHPNSLGRTVEVVDQVLAAPERMEELFDCYGSDDPVVRLRVSSSMKRVEVANHALVVAYIDRFIDEIGALDQASAQWTLAHLFDRLSKDMSAEQHAGALRIMKRNLAENEDWIVLNTTLDTLSKWAKTDPELKRWMHPHTKRLAADTRKSVANRAAKTLKLLYGE